MPRKKTLLFFTLVIFSFVLMTYQSKNSHSLSVNFISGPLNRLHASSHSLTEAVKRPFRMIALREKENVELKKKVAELELEAGRYREVVLENKRFRDLLSLREYKNNYISSARVIARGTDNWTHTLLIDKGAKDNLAKDMAAITPKGLAGKITNVSDSYANLLLLNDINFSASVRLQGSRAEGVLSGTGSRKCILKYVPFEDAVKTGDIVITSGLDMLFPPGIPVGYVTKVDSKTGGGYFQYIEVQPFQDSTKIEEVAIVK
jgi:rod shape-determining protein MreC